MKKILVVDDSKEVRLLVCATLETDEYIVLQAQDATEALQLCAEHKPHVVIMDINMPGNINGIKATTMLKNSPDTADCQVIMLSGMTGKKEIEEAVKAGAIGYLKKPFSPLELIEKVESVFAKRT